MEQLQIPKGKIIDLEKSDLSKNLIVLKDAPKKLVVDSWEELGNIKGFFIDKKSELCNTAFGALDCIDQNKNIYPTKKHIKRALAEPQLSQIRERALEEYGGWEPDWEDEEQTKYCLTTKANNIILLGCNSYFEFLSFPTEEMAEEFLAKHKGLLMDWFMIEEK
jgi:hypothetical protein